jgi:hypothetical protein
MKLKTCLVLLLSFLLLSAHLLAFNGQRKGFILGGGAGAGFLSYETYGLKSTRFSLATNFKIGYAPTDSFEIYYLASTSWFWLDGTSCFIGLTAVGLTQYLNPKGTGFYVTGGIGLSSLQFLSGDEDYTNGFGLLGGIGYQVSKHWSLQGDVLYTTMKSGQIKSLGARVTFNYLAF